MWIWILMSSWGAMGGGGVSLWLRVMLMGIMSRSWPLDGSQSVNIQEAAQSWTNAAATVICWTFPST